MTTTVMVVVDIVGVALEKKISKLSLSIENKFV